MSSVFFEMVGGKNKLRMSFINKQKRKGIKEQGSWRSVKTVVLRKSIALKSQVVLRKYVQYDFDYCPKI
jgi:hypothetical protein